MLKKPCGKRFSFKIDLTKIKGTGDFPCPYCGNTISPDDETCDAYQIIETKMKKDDSLEEIIISCNECESSVHIFGFESLTDINLRVFSLYYGPQIFGKN
jgi:predicted RNA-binding Zn-ribbon protein involved in translation (DUF1610 family)